MRSSLICLIVLAAAPAFAQPALPEAAPASLPAAAPVSGGQVEIGVHAYGMAIGSFLTELDASKKVFNTPGGRTQGVYPGFGGFGGGGGIAVDVSWRGIIGLQLGLFGSVDQGDGSINDEDFVLGQTALHLPILVKVAAPVPTVRPFAVIGPEFVFPGEATTDKDSAGGVGISGKADTYLALAFGFGFEFVLPVEGMDVRIPLTIRGAWNPSIEDTLESRARLVSNAPAEIEFRSEWEWQTLASLGVAFYFRP